MREEGKLDLGSSSEDNFHDGLGVPPAATAELVGNAHSSRWERSPIFYFFFIAPFREKQIKSLSCSRSTSACVSPLADTEAGNLFYDFNNSDVSETQ